MVNVWHWISHRLHMLSGCHTRYSISLFTFHLRRFASYWVFYRLHFPECRLGSIILLHARSSFNAFQWNGIYCFRSLRTYRFSFIFEQYYSEFSLSRWIVPQKRPRSVGVTAAMRNLCTLSADELMCGVALTLDRDTYVECTEREREKESYELRQYEFKQEFHVSQYFRFSARAVNLIVRCETVFVSRSLVISENVKLKFRAQ